jgi:ankyrin repeat protein
VRRPAAHRTAPLLLALCGAALTAGAAESGSLLDAVKGGDAAELRGLLSERTNPNEADADGTSALHWAVHQGDRETAASLIKAGAAVDAPNRYGIRPSYLAAENGDAGMMRALLEAGADPNAVFAEGETVLMTAARTGNVATMEALIKAGADVSAKEGRDGQTALMWAAAADNGPAVTALLKAGADREALDGTGMFKALGFAVRGGAVHGVKALLDGGANPNDTMPGGMSMLVLALANANYEVASALLDYNADPNAAAQGWTPLHQVALVRRWVRGFNLPGPEHHDQTSSLDLVRKLAAHGADVNARQTAEPHDGNRNGMRRLGATPFLLATKSLDLPYMQLLLDLGADPKLATDEGTNAVMLAAGVGQGFGSAGASPGSIEEAIAALDLTLKVGAGTVNDKNKANETPLHGAMYRGGSIELIDYLVEHGASLEGVANDRGWTPLRIADGIALDGVAFIRYPETAAHVRDLMAARGLPIPPVEWDGPGGVYKPKNGPQAAANGRAGNKPGAQAKNKPAAVAPAAREITSQ